MVRRFQLRGRSFYGPLHGCKGAGCQTYETRPFTPCTTTMRTYLASLRGMQTMIRYSLCHILRDMKPRTSSCQMRKLQPYSVVHTMHDALVMPAHDNSLNVCRELNWHPVPYSTTRVRRCACDPSSSPICITSTYLFNVSHCVNLNKSLTP